MGKVTKLSSDFSGISELKDISAEEMLVSRYGSILDYLKKQIIVAKADKEINEQLSKITENTLKELKTVIKNIKKKESLPDLRKLLVKFLKFQRRYFPKAKKEEKPELPQSPELPSEMLPPPPGVPLKASNNKNIKTATKQYSGALGSEIEAIISKLDLNCQPEAEEFLTNMNLGRWKWISAYLNLSEEFMVEFRSYVNWPNIFQFQDLSENFIRSILKSQFFNEIDLAPLFKYQKLSSSFIKEFKDMIMNTAPLQLLENQNVKKEDKRQIQKELTNEVVVANWTSLLKDKPGYLKYLPSDVRKSIEENYVINDAEKTLTLKSSNNKLVKVAQEYSPALREELDNLRKRMRYNCTVEDFPARLNNANWNWIIDYETLSEEFILAFQNQLDMDRVSRHQKLSESFIDANKEILYWPWISQFQKLSREFIEKHKDLVSFGDLCINELLDKDLRNDMCKIINKDRANRMLADKWLRLLEDKPGYFKYLPLDVRKEIEKNYIIDETNQSIRVKPRPDRGASNKEITKTSQERKLINDENITGDKSKIYGNAINISGDVTNISGNVSNISGNVLGISGNVSEVWGDVSNISGDVSFLYGNVSNISGDVSCLCGDVTGMSGDASIITKNIYKIKERRLQDAQLLEKWKAIVKKTPGYLRYAPPDIKKQLENKDNTTANMNTQIKTAKQQANEIVDTNTTKELIKHFAESIQNAININHKDTNHSIDKENNQITILSKQDKDYEPILQIDVNKALNIYKIIPVGQLSKDYPIYSLKFYQYYWKPIVKSVGHIFIEDLNVLFTPEVQELPDVPRNIPTTYPLKGWNVNDKKEEIFRICFLGDKEEDAIWLILKKAIINQEKIASTSKYNEQDYFNAIVKCIDKQLESIYGRSGVVKQVIPRTDTIEVDVDFGRGLDVVRLSEDQIEIIEDV